MIKTATRLLGLESFLRRNEADLRAGAAPDFVVPGYAGQYDLTAAGDLVASFYRDDKGKYARGVAYPVKALRARLTVASSEETPWDSSRYVPVILGDDGPLPSPAYFFHSDVLPAIYPRAELTAELFCAAVVATVSTSDDGNLTKGMTLSPERLAEIRAVEPADGIRGLVGLAGEIRSCARLSDPGVDRLTIATGMGDLPVLIAAGDLDAGSRERLAPGAWAKILGWLFANVAAGEYASGPVYNLENDLAVLRDCLNRNDFDRALKIFSPDCVYLARGEFRARGPRAIVDSMNSVAEKIKALGKKFHTAFGQVSVEEQTPEKPFRDGDKCLIFLTGDGGIYNCFFASTDAAGKINRLETVYEFVEGDAARQTDDFELWRDNFNQDSRNPA